MGRVDGHPLIQAQHKGVEVHELVPGAVGEEYARYSNLDGSDEQSRFCHCLTQELHIPVQSARKDNLRRNLRRRRPL